MSILFVSLVFIGCHIDAPTANSHDCFVIQVVDDQTGRGVPLVELKTVNDIRLYTDSAGVVTLNEPGLMNQAVYFHVSSHGYEFPADGFGYRGKRLEIRPGGESTLRIKRKNIAERLYRVTGGGIYRDSLIAGKQLPVRQPVLNGQVLGSDSVVNTIYKGKVHWFWGDTNRPSYPLGNFDVPGAVSRLPSDGGLDPEIGIDLEYFVDGNGFARPMAKMPGQGPTWITGLVTLKDEDGGEVMFASYVKIQPPLKVYERGLARFDDETNQFKKDVILEMDAPLYPDGHPVKHVDDGIEYVYFATPFPLVRVRATPSDLRDLKKYEAYTCLKEGSRKGSIEVERLDGQPVFGWKRNAIPYTPKLQADLIKSGRIEADAGLFQLWNVDGKPVMMHGGSVYWNDYRRRWIMIAVEHFGTSALGEIWYAESMDLIGPWTNAKKVVTHENYSFYNPKQHPMFDKDGGRFIFFEGTYTNTFSGNDDKTPRYNYNQIMYKLDLSDPRLGLGDRPR